MVHALHSNYMDNHDLPVGSKSTQLHVWKTQWTVVARRTGMELGDVVYTATLTLKEGSEMQIYDETIGLGL